MRFMILVNSNIRLWLRFSAKRFRLQLSDLGACWIGIKVNISVRRHRDNYRTRNNLQIHISNEEYRWAQEIESV